MIKASPLPSTNFQTDAPTAENLFIQCPDCPFQAPSPFQLRKHAISLHLMSDPQVPPRRFACEFYICAFCGLACSDNEKVKEHVKVCHFSTSVMSSQVAIMQQKLVLSPCSAATSSLSADSEDDMMDTRVPLLTSPNTFSLTPTLHMFHPLTTAVPTTDAWSTPNTCASVPASCVSTFALTPAPILPIPTTLPPIASKTEIVPVSKPSTLSGYQNWSELVGRADKKFTCLMCRRFIYSGRTEVVFHAVTRHLLAKEIHYDLAHHGRLTDQLKRRIGHNFAEGMRIRSGVHYKDAKRVEAALFRSIELHLRYRPYEETDGTSEQSRYHSCSGCGATFNEIQVAYAHINDELRSFLPEFMRARSCPWSLSSREEWVWCVPDLPIEQLPGKYSRITTTAKTAESEEKHAAHMTSDSTIAGSLTSPLPIIESDTTAAASTVELVKSLVANASLLQGTGPSIVAKSSSN